MKSALASIAATLFLAASTAAQQLTINTPLSVVVCQPLLITWTGGTPPYFLSILPGNQPTAPALLDFGSPAGNSLTWTVNVTAGTALGLNLRDSTGALAQSGVFTVQSSSNTACLNAAPAPGSSSAAGSSSAPSGSVSSPPANPTPTPSTTPLTTPSTTPLATPSTTPSTTPRPTTSGSGSTTAPATTSNSAGFTHNLNIGLAGVLGAVVALLA